MPVNSRQSVLRQGSEKAVEDYHFPKWDKDGNLIKTAKKPQKVKKPTEVEDIEETVVKVPTVKEIEAIREEAYNEGFEQGYENGLAQGQQEGKKLGHSEGHEKGYADGFGEGRKAGSDEALNEERQKTDEKLSVFNAASDALKQQVATEQDELEEALLALSIRIARQVLQDELRLKPNHIATVVHAAVQSLPNPDEKLTVLLNPAELDFVETIADSHWTLEGDQSISVGGCRVKSAFSYVDYTLEHRFENAVTHLISSLPNVNEEALSNPISEEFLMRTEHAEADSNAEKTEDVTAENTELPAEALEQTLDFDTQTPVETNSTVKSERAIDNGLTNEGDEGEVGDVEDEFHSASITETDVSTLETPDHSAAIESDEVIRSAQEDSSLEQTESIDQSSDPVDQTDSHAPNSEQMLDDPDTAE